jgi:hypothetical protein
MTPEEQQELDECVQRIAQLLHGDAQAKGMPVQRLADIEVTVREQMQTHVAPQMGVFLSTRLVPPSPKNISER